MEKLARIFDSEILPAWSEPFGRLLLRDLVVPAGGQVLDVCCATGYPAVEILRGMGGSGRLIAIDSTSSLLDVARRKVQAMGAKNAFLRTESAVPRLSFADDVYDLTVCHLGLLDMPDMGAAIADFARVTRMGGEVRCTLPLAGTFTAFHELFREVLRRRGRDEAEARLDRHIARYPTVQACEAWMHAAGLDDVRVAVEPLSLGFGSAQELFRAPVIEYGFLPWWKAVAGPGREMQDVFWELKDAVEDRIRDQGSVTPGFEMIAVAGCLVGRKQRAAVAVEPPGPPAPAPVRRDEVTEHMLDESDIEEIGESRTAQRAARSTGQLTTQLTTQIDIDDIVELRDMGPDITATSSASRTGETVVLDDTHEGGLDIDDLADIELDAFIVGQPRPSHLPNPREDG